MGIRVIRDPAPRFAFYFRDDAVTTLARYTEDVFIVLYPFFQAVLGWSGLLATVGLMPMALLMMVFSGVAPRLSAKIGPKATIASGVLLGGAGLALMALLVSVDGGYLSVLPGMITMGVGMR